MIASELAILKLRPRFHETWETMRVEAQIAPTWTEVLAHNSLITSSQYTN